MTEADGVKIELDSIESDLDTLVNQASVVTTLAEEMQGKMLALNLTGAIDSLHGNGIGIIETIRSSNEFILNEAFILRKVLRDHRDKL